MACGNCGSVLREVRFDDGAQLLLRGASGNVAALWFGCARCARATVSTDGEYGHLITGVAAEHLLRRLFAHTNFAGGTEKMVREAMDVVDSFPDPDELVRQASLQGRSLGGLGETRSLALEIALNGAVERQLLQMELQELESRWREEEEIAAIADGILTPVPGWPAR